MSLDRIALRAGAKARGIAADFARRMARVDGGVHFAFGHVSLLWWISRPRPLMAHTCRSIGTSVHLRVRSGAEALHRVSYLPLEWGSAVEKEEEAPAPRKGSTHGPRQLAHAIAANVRGESRAIPHSNFPILIEVVAWPRVRSAPFGGLLLDVGRPPRANAAERTLRRAEAMILDRRADAGTALAIRNRRQRFIFFLSCRYRPAVFK